MFICLGILFLIAGLLNFTCSVLILRELHRAGIGGGSMETRWHVAKHLKTYKELSYKKNGSTGWPYYGYPVTFFLLILFFVLALASLSPSE